MRFLNFVAAFATIAGLTSASQESSIDARAVSSTTTTTTKTTKINSCRKKAGAAKLRFMPRALEELWDNDGSTYYVYESGFLPVSNVKTKGDKVVVNDVSGCSAVFFFNTVGQASAADIMCGEEAVEAPQAATMAKAAGTTASVVIYSSTSTIAAKIQAGIKTKLPTITFDLKEYALDVSKQNKRWMFTHVSGDTTNKVTKAEYECEL